jgi:phospholipid/cholesterol/gamma-HCH transport system substrate-binding protein
MENRAYALAAGLFTLLLGLAAAGLIWWLGQNKQDVAYYILEGRDNVTGLNAQAAVRYRGIRAGRVENIDIDAKDRRLILVRISLDARYPLTAGTVAKLNTQGVTGLAYIQLEDDGNDTRPLVGKGGETPRIALSPTLLDTLGAQAGDVVEQVNLLAVRLTKLLDEKNLRNFSRGLENLAAASESLNNNLNNLPPVIAALQRTFSDANVSKLSSALTSLDKTAGEAAPLAQDIRATMRTVQSLTSRLDKLAGDAGGELTNATLPRANALVQELATSSRQLSRLIETIDREPQALVFGRAAPAPGPGEAGFVAPGT